MLPDERDPEEAQPEKRGEEIDAHRAHELHEPRPCAASDLRPRPHAGERRGARCASCRTILRTLKRRYRKIGVEFKYILSTEKGGRGGRIHHHLIISGGLDRDTLESLWGRGYANSKRLQFGDEGVSGLTHYITKDDASYKRWSGSRNLDRLEAATSDGKTPMDETEELAEAVEDGLAYDWFEERYPEFELVSCECIRNSMNRGAYIHFEMRRRR